MCATGSASAIAACYGLLAQQWFEDVAIVRFSNFVTRSAGTAMPANQLSTVRSERSAVLVGALVAVGGNLVMSMILGTTILVAFLSQGVPQAELLQRLLAAREFPYICAGMGVLTTLSGGYLTAYLVTQHRLFHAAMTGLAAAVLGLAVALVLGTALSPLALSVQLSLGVIAAMVGGWMAMPVPVAAPANSDFEL